MGSDLLIGPRAQKTDRCVAHFIPFVGRKGGTENFEVSCASTMDRIMTNG